MKDAHNEFEFKNSINLNTLHENYLKLFFMKYLIKEKLFNMKNHLKITLSFFE